ncbi:hypothetical protein JZ751_025126 [Albula glossodonta]|uniref:Uncharacterized protein n=1 Tax=Albula glossodonta TaxID=121402 RepID=A0A8T2PFD2_9TELE|nr:hypothetical protein JZ751_025126 [Albula glossodonta]
MFAGNGRVTEALSTLQLLDIGEAMNATRGASVSQLGVEDQPGSGGWGWRGRGGGWRHFHIPHCRTLHLRWWQGAGGFSVLHVA